MSLSSHYVLLLRYNDVGLLGLLGGVEFVLELSVLLMVGFYFEFE